MTVWILPIINRTTPPLELELSLEKVVGKLEVPVDIGVYIRIQNTAVDRKEQTPVM